jgi:hypothetical protein
LIIFIEKLGWRDTLNYIGYIGIFFGLLGLILIKEPQRGRFKTSLEVDIPKEEKSLVESFKTSVVGVLDDDVTRYCTIAGMFRFFTMYSFDYYLPTFFL